MVCCRRFALLFILILASGCSSISYYSQSLNGHLAVLHAAKPIEDWMADPSTSLDLKTQLEKVRQIRAFASLQLGLPDNTSYTSYADVRRPFVVWNVFAAPEFSLKLKKWCYPITGCVTYRGYYSKDDTDAYAATLRQEGWDVVVSGIPAYSTLGLTPDPVLSTFINQPEAELARLIFHELAHQVVYVKDDTRFNESFATAVEEEGVQRWLRARNDGALTESYRLQSARRKAYVDLLGRYRLRLEAIYANSSDTVLLRTNKQQQFAALKAEYARMKIDPASALYQYNGNDRSLGQDGMQDLNNAHLAAVATYTQWVPAYAKLLRDCGSELLVFYQAVKQLATLPPDDRQSALYALLDDEADTHR